MLELYHWAPNGPWLKPLIVLAEKDIDCTFHPLDVLAFEQYGPAVPAPTLETRLNPEGEGPLLVHDGRQLTESFFICEYLDTVFEGLALRPTHPVAFNRMLTWARFINEVLMPAVNTPQFTWCKSKMPRKPQPVAPIFQPEVAGRAVRWAAHHPGRRELLVGYSTWEAVWGTKFIPGLLDSYLGKTGYDSQQYDSGREPGAPVNLMEPVAGDFGAHGEFDDRSNSHSRYTWAEENRYWLAGAVGIAFLSALLAARSA